MRNAKQEFIELVKDAENQGFKLQCAAISYQPRKDASVEGTKESGPFHLRIGFAEEDYARFIESLDFEYPTQPGKPQIFGNIWFSGGTWAERIDAGWGEWWDFNFRPQIPECLDRANPRLPKWYQALKNIGAKKGVGND